MKAKSAQYPWLKRGMLYHLMSTLDSLVSQIILDMGYYSPGKQASTFKKSFDVATKDKPHLAWLDETFLHFLIKKKGTLVAALRRHHLKQLPRLHRSQEYYLHRFVKKVNPQNELFLQQKGVPVARGLRAPVPVARGLRAPHQAATTSPTVRLHYWVRLLNKCSKP
jgi:hypothetical protein